MRFYYIITSTTTIWTLSSSTEALWVQGALEQGTAPPRLLGVLYNYI